MYARTWHILYMYVYIPDGESTNIVMYNVHLHECIVCTCTCIYTYMYVFAILYLKGREVKWANPKLGMRNITKMHKKVGYTLWQT